MRERTSQALYNYWNEVRGSRLAPRRFEIEPSRITTILPETFILEQQAQRDFVFRLAGTRVCEQFGREFRNINMLELWATDDQQIIGRLLETVSRDGAVAVVRFDAVASPRRTINYEMIILPLIHNGAEITRLLGSMATSESPPWLGLDPFTALHITDFNTVWPDGRPHALIARSSEPAPFTTSPAGRTVRSRERQFRVFDGGRAGDAPETPAAQEEQQPTG